MLKKIETDCFYIPPDKFGMHRNGTNFREDSFAFPPKLLYSERIRSALELVTNKYVFYLLAADPECKDGIFHKCNHTNDVVRVILQIHTDVPGYTLEDAICIALTHDIFRPIQGALFNKFSDNITGIDHGDEGAALVAKHFEPDKETGKYSRYSPAVEIIYQAVIDHNKLEPKFSGPWIDEIRDADRIAIYLRIFDHAAVESYKHGNGTAISSEVLAAFTQGRLVNRKYVVSETDDWICSLAWIWDFKVQKAREYIVKLRLPERIVEHIITHFNPNAEEVEHLKTGVLNWYAHYQLDTKFGIPYFSDQRAQMPVESIALEAAA